jgi:hypothetical protein
LADRLLQPWEAVMTLKTKDAAPFPTRFELKYSLEEMLRYNDRRWRRQEALADSQSSWARLIAFTFLASSLSFLALAAGVLSKNGLPLVAVLLSAAFLGGLYVAGFESSRTSKRILETLYDRGKGFGPWDIVVSEQTIEGREEGCAFRLDLAAIRSVAVDGPFVVLAIDPTLDFHIPKRCLGDDQAVQAFKYYVETRRGSTRLP